MARVFLRMGDITNEPTCSIMMIRFKRGIVVKQKKIYAGMYEFQNFLGKSIKDVVAWSMTKKYARERHEIWNGKEWLSQLEDEKMSNILFENDVPAPEAHYDL